MCGRFALKTPTASLREVMHFDNTPRCDRRYNIAPSQQILIVRNDQGRRIAEMMHWGLIPSWAKDPEIGNRMINARAESLAEKPAFRDSFRRRRCLIPADGFYEWQARKDARKQPYFIRTINGEVMALAGIWDSWRSPAGEEIRSCAIVTVDAVSVVADIHKRMPAIIHPSSYDLWLDPAAAPDQLQELLRPPENIDLQSYPVDRKVNAPETDSPDCIAPIESQQPPGLF
ncbi:MAG: SOS response-associated peptidase [Planctomycetota bacterium]|jgi:putative SOS response-associated peptidase YedK